MVAPRQRPVSGLRYGRKGFGCFGSVCLRRSRMDALVASRSSAVGFLVIREGVYGVGNGDFESEAEAEGDDGSASLLFTV